MWTSRQRPLRIFLIFLYYSEKRGKFQVICLVFQNYPNLFAKRKKVEDPVEKCS